MSSVFGTSNGGTITNLVALGAVDAYLVKGASMTYFRFRYARHTNFAMEAISQAFQIQPAFGGTSQIVFNRVGDLIYHMYVVIDLPAIHACSTVATDPAQTGDCACTGAAPNADSYAYLRQPNGVELRDEAYFDSSNPKGTYMANTYSACYNANIDDDTVSSVEAMGNMPWCHWSNAIGQLLIKRAVLVVGGHIADTLYSDYLFMWEELSGKAGKRLQEMIGKRTSRRDLIRDARHPQRLYVPLPWWFTQTSGNTLPLCTLQFHGVQVNIEWEQLKKCVVVSDANAVVRRCDNGAVLQNSDLSAFMDTTYIHLDIDERNRFSMANFDQLVSQVQVQAVQVKTSQINQSIVFNHPIIELIWAVRRMVNENSNNYFNYSGLLGKDPIVNVELRLNNQTRFGGHQAAYYRLVQPYQHHSSIPNAYIYSYSFALYPEEPQPSGSCNFSRIDNVDMTFTLQSGLENEICTLILFARNWNIMRYSEGLGGLLFNS